jgi:hypothetical protein
MKFQKGEWMSGLAKKRLISFLTVVHFACILPAPVPQAHVCPPAQPVLTVFVRAASSRIVLINLFGGLHG